MSSVTYGPNGEGRETQDENQEGSFTNHLDVPLGFFPFLGHGLYRLPLRGTVGEVLM